MVSCAVSSHTSSVAEAVPCAVRGEKHIWLSSCGGGTTPWQASSRKDFTQSDSKTFLGDRGLFDAGWFSGWEPNASPLAGGTYSIAQKLLAPPVCEGTSVHVWDPRMPPPPPGLIANPTVPVGMSAGD